MATSTVPTDMTRASLRAWSAVLAVAAGTFTVVTTEMLPVGLLTPMATTLGITPGTAGSAVTVPGIVAAVAAPAVAVLTQRFDRRVVLAGLLGVLAVANVVAALTPSFSLLLAGRVAAGVTVGGVWAVAAGLAPRLVGAGRAATGTAVIFSGIAVASVLGVPAGTFIGQLAGWRSGFWVLAALAVTVLIALLVLLPPLPPTHAVRLSDVPVLLRSTALRTGLLITLLLVVGQFAAYTYLRPVLEQISHVDVPLISGLLLAYGAAGVIGNFVAGSAAGRALHRTLLVLGGLVALSMFLFPVAGPGAAVAGVLVVAWGLGYGGMSVSLQTWMARATPQATEGGSALFVSTFNTGIALGSFSGGWIVNGAGIVAVLCFGGGTVLLGMTVVLAHGLAARRRAG